MVATNLFNIRQGHFEYLRIYLARFNEATVKEFFVEVFQNGLRVGHFSESLT